MKIAICISHVLDTTSKINFTDNNTVFDKTGVQFIINPNDEFGLSKAISIKEKQFPDATITVINVGEAETEPTLRKALAIGADNAIRINTKPTDSFKVAELLADVIKKEAFDIVITGKESLDYNGGMVGGIIAGLLDYNYISACTGLEIDGNTAKITREGDNGKEFLTTSTPFLIAGQKGLVAETELRIPNMRGIMSAKTKPLTVVEPTTNNEYSKPVSFENLPPKQAVKLISTDEIDKLIELLHTEAKVI